VTSVPGACRSLIETIHDYQRQGGLTRQFEQIDRAVTDYFVVTGTAVPERSVRSRESSHAGTGKPQEANWRIRQGNSNREDSPFGSHSLAGSDQPDVNEQ
jgi:hypothetical protein